MRDWISNSEENMGRRKRKDRFENIKSNTDKSKMDMGKNTAVGVDDGTGEGIPVGIGVGDGEGGVVGNGDGSGVGKLDGCM